MTVAKKTAPNSAKQNRMLEVGSKPLFFLSPFKHIKDLLIAVEERSNRNPIVTGYHCSAGSLANDPLHLARVLVIVDCCPGSRWHAFVNFVKLLCLGKAGDLVRW